MTTPVLISSGRLDAPGFRPCCLLNSDGKRFDDSSPREHQYGNGKDEVGIVYACRAGFLDIGHARDLLDLTRYYHDCLKRSAGAKGSKFQSFHYHEFIGDNVTIVKAIPPARLLYCAARLAYLESIFHEIESYWYFDYASSPGTISKPFPGMHNSSFSPEDLVSNAIGTSVGMRAILSLEDGTYASFDEAATNALEAILGDLGATGDADVKTADAFASVSGRWYDPVLPGVWWALSTLKRRNFGTGGNFNEVTPWLVSSIAACTDVTWPAGIDRSWDTSIDDSLEITYYPPLRGRVSEAFRDYMANRTVKPSDFVSEILRIQNHAIDVYGPKFDSPDL